MYKSISVVRTISVRCILWNMYEAVAGKLLRGVYYNAPCYTWPEKIIVVEEKPLDRGNWIGGLLFSGRMVAGEIRINWHGYCCRWYYRRRLCYRYYRCCFCCCRGRHQNQYRKWRFSLRRLLREGQGSQEDESRGAAEAKSAALFQRSLSLLLCADSTAMFADRRLVRSTTAAAAWAVTGDSRGGLARRERWLRRLLLCALFRADDGSASPVRSPAVAALREDLLLALTRRRGVAVV